MIPRIRACQPPLLLQISAIEGRILASHLSRTLQSPCAWNHLWRLSARRALSASSPLLLGQRQGLGQANLPLKSRISQQLEASERSAIPQAPSEPEPPTPLEAVPPPAPPQESTAPPNRTKPPGRRPARRLLAAAAFLLVGTALGSSVRLVLQPPTPPEPGSSADAYTTSLLRAEAARLPIVQSLSDDPAWTHWEAYSGLSAAKTTARITTNALGGSRGVGAFQRVFHNADTGECVSVIYFGPATTGWPGVVHGGAIATILDESCGRCAMRRFPAKTGVTARLELSYLAPTLANGFYVVRAAPVQESELPAEERGKTDRKMWVRARLEDLRGKVCVEARSLFVVPKGLELAELSETF